MEPATLLAVSSTQRREGETLADLCFKTNDLKPLVDRLKDLTVTLEHGWDLVPKGTEDDQYNRLSEEAAVILAAIVGLSDRHYAANAEKDGE